MRRRQLDPCYGAGHRADPLGQQGRVGRIGHGGRHHRGVGRTLSVRNSFASAALTSSASFNAVIASSPQRVVIFINVVGCGTRYRTGCDRTAARRSNRTPPGTTTRSPADSGTSRTSTADRSRSGSTAARSGHGKTRRTARRTADRRAAIDPSNSTGNTNNSAAGSTPTTSAARLQFSTRWPRIRSGPRGRGHHLASSRLTETRHAATFSGRSS